MRHSDYDSHLNMDIGYIVQAAINTPAYGENTHSYDLTLERGEVLFANAKTTIVHGFPRHLLWKHLVIFAAQHASEPSLQSEELRRGVCDNLIGPFRAQDLHSGIWYIPGMIGFHEQPAVICAGSKTCTVMHQENWQKLRKHSNAAEVLLAEIGLILKDNAFEPILPMPLDECTELTDAGIYQKEQFEALVNSVRRQS